MIIKKRKIGETNKNHDVLISIRSDKSVRISFRQGSYWAITKTQYMNVSLEDGQIFFEESDEDGFKVSVAEKASHVDYGVVSVRSSKDLLKWAEENGGRYDLTKKNGRFTIINRR